MKTFKIKDLVVSLDTDSIPAAGDAAQPHCATPSILCQTPTLVACPTHTICATPTVLCHTPTICHTPTLLCHIPTICINHTLTNCGGCSFNPCSHLASLITPTTTPWKTTSPVQTVVENFSQKELDEFKAHLTDLQKHVDQKAKGNPEDLDLLEKKLNEAIEDVRAQKAKLKHK